MVTKTDKSRWITADKKIPNDNRPVLCFCSHSDGSGWFAISARTCGTEDMGKGFGEPYVKYWMPLPPTPEGYGDPFPYAVSEKQYALLVKDEH